MIVKGHNNKRVALQHFAVMVAGQPKLCTKIKYVFLCSQYDHVQSERVYCVNRTYLKSASPFMVVNLS